MAHPATMNNHAVALIRNGEYDEAVMTLGKSLKKVKLVMSGDAKIPFCHEGHDDGELCCDFASSGVHFLGTYGLPGTNMSSIFQDCIIIRGFPPSSLLDKCELISYAILYNLALVHHLKAIKESLSEVLRTDLLNKAMTLYEHAHHILVNQEAEVSMIHTMAIASNLGHVHCMLGDEGKARLCFQHLLSTMLYVVDCGEARKIEEFDGFFKNVMPLLSKTDTAAAA